MCSSACCSRSVSTSLVAIARLQYRGMSPLKAACGTQVTPEKTGLPEWSRTMEEKWRIVEETLAPGA
jgi:hypothetical protein